MVIDGYLTEIVFFVDKEDLYELKTFMVGLHMAQKNYIAFMEHHNEDLLNIARWFHLEEDNFGLTSADRVLTTVCNYSADKPFAKLSIQSMYDIPASLFTAIINENFPKIKFVFETISDLHDVFINTDTEGLFFPERAIVVVEDYGYYLFDHIDDAYETVEDNFGREVAQCTYDHDGFYEFYPTIICQEFSRYYNE